MNRGTARRAIRSRPPSSVGNRGAPGRGAPSGRGATGPPTSGTAVRGIPSGRRIIAARGVSRGVMRGRGAQQSGTKPAVAEENPSVQDLTSDDHRDVTAVKEAPEICQISGIQSQDAQDNEPPLAVVKKEPTTPVVKKEPTTPVVKKEPSTPVAKKEPTTPVVKKEPLTPVAQKEPTTPVVEEPSPPPVVRQPPLLNVMPAKSILKKPHKSDISSTDNTSILSNLSKDYQYQDISPAESEKSLNLRGMETDDQNKSPNTNGNDTKMDYDESKSNDENMETETSASSRKRKNDGEKGFSPRKKRKSDHLMVPKNPLMKLNELKPGLSYVIEKQEGPSHNPTFWVSVTVDGEKHIGKGRSKQDAKHSAALAALSSFVQFPDQSEVSQMMPQVFSGKTDFTSDSLEDQQIFFNVSDVKQKKYADFPQIFIPKRSRIQKALAGFESKSPVMLLNELHPGSEYTLIDEMSSIPAHRFTMAVNVNNTLYEGNGQSKKQAKAAAARAALVSIYHIPLTGNYSTMNTGDATTITMSGLEQAVADKIASTVYETFSQIIVGFDDNKKWKVLSGIVMTTDEEMEKVTVIGVSTGTKCISGEHISMNGAVLNDCHAEIISRRCFKDFLYSQLERFAEPGAMIDDLVIVKNENGGFSLKPHVKFHLFISTAPCGDARIFSPHELEFGDKVDKHPNRKGRGLLRTKIEAGEGTIPVKSGESIQTWDGIQGGQRLLTMSCSDKIARWNVLGLQGTLLSLYFEPIYLESIILGSMYHEDHMYRAIGKRIEGAIGALPNPYRLIIPKINIVTSTETRQASKSPTYSVNWSLGLSNPEIVNGTTGKLYNGQFSRLAKRTFFTRFQKIRPKLKFLPGSEMKFTINYVETKTTVTDYQNAKEVVFKAFQDAGLGAWVKKPPEQDDFEVSF